ncbi:protein FAM185A [Terrapene carolina triunguis]|uniref:protein FAM185A n=1 Tax=Terrapene triunguis TaxID=2587831 RepID=UPI0011567962|nr:protein FAM185A [Terrapene carolina triunguis]
MRAPCPGWWHLGVRVAGVRRGLLSSGGPWRGTSAGSWSRSALFVTSPAGPEEGRKRGNKPLKEWTLIVSPFGQLKVRLPCHVTVRPLDPLRYPDADRALVTVSGVDSSLPQGVDLDRLQVKYDEALKEMMIVSDHMDSKAAVVVKTPMKFVHRFLPPDLLHAANPPTQPPIESESRALLACVLLGISSYRLQKLEDNSVCSHRDRDARRGLFFSSTIPMSSLNSEKLPLNPDSASHKIHVRTKGGKVICLGTLHGNADIHAAEKSSVNIEKLQGTSIKISTEDGLLKTKYLYAESSFLSSTAGDILLGSIHGDTTLQTKTGNITVESSDGCLKASTRRGEIDVYVNQVRKVDLKSQKGSITVKVPASLKAYLQLSGSKVDVSPEIQLQETQCAPKEGHITITGHMNQMNERDKWIKADTQDGTVHLKSQSWFQSIKLQVP